MSEKSCVFEIYLISVKNRAYVAGAISYEK